MKVEDVTADAAPSENPADGDVVNALIKAELVSATGQTSRADYVLTLTARADRREVNSIVSTPAAIKTNSK